SPSSRPTMSSAVGSWTGASTSPATTDSSAPGGILQAHPPPWAYEVSRAGAGAEAMGPTLVTTTRRRHPVDAGPTPRAVLVCREASGHLVVPAVFKTDVAEYLGQAGSIPVRLRHQPSSAGERSARSPSSRRPATRAAASPPPTPCSAIRA